ncbi:MAG: signal peptidase I [Candidatus Acidiferrales bacterium]
MSAATAISPVREPLIRAIGESAEGVSAIAHRIRTRGSACVRVLGASMFPWIRSGDLVFVSRIDFDRVRRGQVILFERAGRLIAHRVLRTASGAAILTKGDSLDRADAPVRREEFLGRVTRLHRRRKHVDMESLAQELLGRCVARFSPVSGLFYRPFRFAKRLFLA